MIADISNQSDRRLVSAYTMYRRRTPGRSDSDIATQSHLFDPEPINNSDLIDNVRDWKSAPCDPDLGYIPNPIYKSNFINFEIRTVGFFDDFQCFMGFRHIVVKR